MLKISRSKIFTQKTLKTIIEQIGERVDVDKWSDKTKVTISEIREQLHIKFLIPTFYKKNKGPHFRISKVDGKIKIQEYRMCKNCFTLTKDYLFIDIDKMKQNIAHERQRIEVANKNRNAFVFKMQLAKIKLDEWFESYENKEEIKDEIKEIKLIAVFKLGYGNEDRLHLNFTTKDNFQITINEHRYNYEKSLEKQLDETRVKVNIYNANQAEKFGFATINEYKNNNKNLICSIKDLTETINNQINKMKEENNG